MRTDVELFAATKGEQAVADGTRVCFDELREVALGVYGVEVGGIPKIRVGNSKGYYVTQDTVFWLCVTRDAIDNGEDPVVQLEQVIAAIEEATGHTCQIQTEPTVWETLPVKIQDAISIGNAYAIKLV